MPLLRRLDPETAHGLALRALRWPMPGRPGDDPILAVEALGLRFGNPLGLAAGFDKDAVALPGLARLGFGFLEAGTVTPRPQPGNPKPRLFRLRQDQAVINRMGFNNNGIEAFVARLGAARVGVPVGANLGINKEGAEPERDYPALVARVSSLASYVVLNVSSPNTPGLRDLQGEARLRAILAAIAERVPEHPPLLVKIAPDLDEAGLRGVIETCLSAGVAGLIVSNTTVGRPAGLRSGLKAEAGGLSGAPLFARSTAMLARARLIAGERLVLVGVGGVFSGREALAKIQAGASLVQLYTAFAYRGPFVIGEIKRDLAHALRAEGFPRIQDAIGTGAERLAAWSGSDWKHGASERVCAAG